MQIRFYNYFLNKENGVIKLIGRFLFLILTLPLIIGSTSHPPAEKAELVEGGLYFSSTNSAVFSEFNSNVILPGDPPIANLDTLNILQGTSGSGNVLTNDSDPDGDVFFRIYRSTVAAGHAADIGDDAVPVGVLAITG